MAEQFCWKENSIKIVVESSKIENIIFEKIGFALRYKCKNDILAFVTDPTGRSETYKFEKNDNHICARLPGVYKV